MVQVVEERVVLHVDAGRMIHAFALRSRLGCRSNIFHVLFLEQTTQPQPHERALNR